MSFKRKEEQSVISKRFVSETELEEIKKKREEEWELARQQGRKIENDEEIHDGRTLYERLKEQKDKKQEEFEEQLKFKNMIYKGLDREDADFLSEVSSKQAEFHARRFDSENLELQSYRAAVESMRTEEPSKPTTFGSHKNSKVAKSSKIETKPKMPAVIIRKRQSSGQNDDPNAKKAKQDVPKNGEDKNLDNKEEKTNRNDVANVPILSSLQGLIAYSDSDDESGDE